MGYVTRYKLEISPLRGVDPPSKEAINSFIKKDRYIESILVHEERAKWYEHEEDLIEHSKLYPEIVFTLSGEGEESDDIWEKDFCNGKMERRFAVISIPPQDFSKFLEA